MNSSAIGNIHQNSLDEIKNSDAIKNIRKLITRGKYLEAGCSPDCQIYKNCLQPGPAILLAVDDRIQKDTAALSNFKTLNAAVQKGFESISCYPITFDIQPMELCNMDCIMCKQDHNDLTKVEPYVFLKLFSNMDYATSIRFQGGEMFADKDFYNVAYDLKQKLKPFQNISVITNGSLLDREELSKLVDGANPVRFIVSIDSPNEKTYSAIRQTKQFEKVWRNLVFLAVKQKQSGIKDIVLWNSVLMRSNFYEIQDSISQAEELGVDIQFNPIIGNYPAENYFLYDSIRENDMLSYLESSLELAGQVAVRVTGLDVIHRRLKKIWG